MSPALSTVLARLMGREPTPAELDEVRRSAVREAMVAVMGEPERLDPAPSARRARREPA